MDTQHTAKKLAEHWRIQHEIAIGQAEKKRARWKQAVCSLPTSEELGLRDEAGLITLGLFSQEDAYATIELLSTEINWHRQVIGMIADAFGIERGEYCDDVIECKTCDGTGTMPCHVCQGRDKHCEICLGRGDLQCPTCYGYGQLTQEDER